MAKFRAILFFIAVVFLAMGMSTLAAGKGQFDTNSGSFNGTAVTTSQTAVFAAFLANRGPEPAGEPQNFIDTAISLSNIGGAGSPTGMTSDFLNLGGLDTQGTLEFYLFNEDGTFTFYETSMDPSVGQNLNVNGELEPGRTYIALLADILEAVGGDRGDSFRGYGWVIANFDAVAGTYNPTVFGVGFTQNFEFTPAVGQGAAGTAGIPVTIP